MKNPHIIRASSIFLIICLLFPVATLSYELIYTEDDGTFSILIFVLIFSIINYLFTIRYCNKLMQVNFVMKRRGQFILYLITSVISFLISVFFLVIFLYDVFENYENTNQSLLFSSNSEWFDMLTIFGLIAYALLGFPLFFMQLYLRKQLIQSDEKIDDLIAAIGSENENTL